MSSIALLATLMAIQGQALQLDQPHEAGLTSIEASWSDRRIPYVRVDDRWLSVIGIDLNAGEGEYPLEVSLEYEDGRVATRTDLIHVQSKSFPTT